MSVFYPGGDALALGGPKGIVKVPVRGCIASNAFFFLRADSRRRGHWSAAVVRGAARARRSKFCAHLLEHVPRLSGWA